jgi:hypothetical protein
MLAELVGWYAGREENRRRYPRIKRDYEAAFSVDAGHSWRSLYGIDMSGGGMCVASEREIPNVIVDIAMTIGEKKVRFKAHPVWNTEVHHNGKKMHTFGLQFTSIGAEDWDTIMKWITGSDSPEVGGLAAARIDESEIAHLLPRELRERMLNELVQRNRFDRKTSPTVQFDYLGITHANGHAMHRLTIHSKVKTVHEEMRYSTRFLCDENGAEVVVLN